MFSGFAMMQKGPTNSKLRTKFLVKIAGLTMNGLLVLLAWTLGSLIWFWVQTSSEVSHAVPKRAPVVQYQLSQLIDSQLFGIFDKNLVPSVSSPINAPVTQLNFTLVGLVATDRPNYGWAIIANNGVQQIYGIDETIKGTGVILHQVLNDRVILRNSNRNETLMLDGVEAIEELAKAALELKKATAKKVKSNPQPVSDGALETIKAEIMRNPKALLKFITLSQMREDGKVVGYRLGAGADRRLFTSAGIKNGDLAVAINGVDLTDPSKMNQIWQNLSDASELTLSVKRDNQLHNIYIGL